MALVTAGTTISVAGNSYPLNSIDSTGEEITQIPCTTLNDTDFKKYIFSTLKETPELEFGFNFDPDLPPVSGTSGTVTVTFPLPSGQSTAATYSGSGTIVNWSFSGEIDGKYEGSMTIKFDGVTGPTFTPSA